MISKKALKGMKKDGKKKKAYPSLKSTTEAIKKRKKMNQDALKMSKKTSKKKTKTA